MTLLCKDCTHFRPGFWHHHDSCRRPVSDKRSPIDGKLYDRLDECSWSERKPGKTLFTRRVRCGPEARYFQPKE